MGSLAKLYNVGKFGRVLSVLLPRVNRSLSDAGNLQAEKKRPASAFASFYREKQGLLKENNPKLSQTELMKLASSMWNNQSQSTRQQFKNEYERKMAEYREDIPQVPKRPAPPYILFFKEKNRLFQSGYPSVVERARKMGSMWNELPESKKEEYREAYTRKLHEFNENLSEEEIELLQQKRKAKNAKREKRDVRRYGKQALKRKPKNPITNAFNLFIRDHASEVPREENIFKYLSEKWHKLLEDEKLMYKERLNDEAEAYNEKLRAWKSKYDKYQ